MALRLERELYSMCWGQGATKQGMALLSPCHRLVPLGVDGASVYVREQRSDAGGRTAERALDWHCGT